MFKENIMFSARRTDAVHLFLVFMTFLDSVSTLRAAIELKSVFDQIQAAEKAGNLSPEEKKRLEEQAAEKGLQALFKVFQFTFIFYFLTNTLPGNKTRSRIHPPRDVRSPPFRPCYFTRKGAVEGRGAADPRRGVYER